jgi:hypothetical protein
MGPRHSSSSTEAAPSGAAAALPPELWALIFSFGSYVPEHVLLSFSLAATHQFHAFVGRVQDLGRWARVCRTFRKVSDTPELWLAHCKRQLGDNCDSLLALERSPASWKQVRLGLHESFSLPLTKRILISCFGNGAAASRAPGSFCSTLVSLPTTLTENTLGL